MKHGSQSVELSLRCHSFLPRPNRFGRKFFLSFSSSFAMDLKKMQPAPTSRHPGPFVHCCKPRSNSSTSPGRKNSRTHCRGSALDELLHNPGSYCASSTSGINNFSRRMRTTVCPNSRSSRDDTSDHGSARWLVTAGTIRILLRAGAGEFSRCRADKSAVATTRAGRPPPVRGIRCERAYADGGSSALRQGGRRSCGSTGDERPKPSARRHYCNQPGLPGLRRARQRGASAW